MAIISAFACLGASLLPFMTGAISNVAGPQVVTYITVALSGVMTITWFMFPSRPPVPFNYGV
ncbi:hypothetical protein BD410DRAFT_781394 [Rickenella mellea]|uniref:Major facilitator superfamily (MFS) profile domain-containing protein n=1 Tax=Rickenella mellea TaxID=50990 RepID=A0A4Y7QPF5_9AGAM|nr:hypothetical protein BD410DRAFT_781394 [Rickenella mellea]